MKIKSIMKQKSSAARLAIVLILIAAFLVAPQANAYIYSIDDGTGVNGVTATSPNDLIWANHFDVVSGAELIRTIWVAFGPLPGGGSTNLDGVAVNLSLWSDPNGDGNPSDAVQLTANNGIVANYFSDVFNVYDIPDTLVSGSFFAAVSLYDPSYTYPARLAGGPSSQSWVNIGTNLQDTFSNESYGFDGSYMIRADTASVPTPEPATMLLLSLGLVGLAGVRRKFKK